MIIWTAIIWAIGLVTVIPAPHLYGTLKNSLLIWMFLLPFYIVPMLIIWMFTKQAYEQDLIVVDKTNLILKTQILWWKKQIIAPLNEVRNFRVDKRWLDKLVSHVAFEYHGQVYRFGARVLTDEAQEIMDRMNSYLSSCNV